MKTVLIVDDNETARTALERALRQAGYETVSACDATEASAAFQAFAVDACLIDYDLPGMNGVQLMSAFQKRRPEVPMSLITGNLSDDVIFDACSAGAAAYFRKPIDLPRLMRWLAKAEPARPREKGGVSITVRWRRIIRRRK